jgi:hypothetical protein
MFVCTVRKRARRARSRELRVDRAIRPPGAAEHTERAYVDVLLACKNADGWRVCAEELSTILAAMWGWGTEARATRRVFIAKLLSVLPLALGRLGALCALAGAPSARARAAFTLSDLQAAMIEKIVTFIDWPSSAGLADVKKPFLVHVLGASEVAEKLAYLFAHQPPWGHKTQVTVVSKEDLPTGAHVLFIAGGFRGDVKDLLKRLNGKPTLTIGSVAGLCAHGIAINLVGAGNRISFEVNRSALARAGLKASYHLLSRARLVDDA